MTTPPEEFRRRLNKLSAVHDKLATSTTPSHQPVVICKRCGKEFVQEKASHHYCYDCYKQYHHQR